MKTTTLDTYICQVGRFIFALLLLLGATGCSGESTPPEEANPVQLEEVVGGPTSEWEAVGGPQMRPLIDSVGRLRARIDSIRYDRFISEVYLPATGTTTLPAGNRLFLDRLKSYLECPTDSCGRADKFIRPVFWLEKDSLWASYSIVGDLPGGERGIDNELELFGDDTLLKTAARNVRYNVYCSNLPKSMPANIKACNVLRGACYYYKHYTLRKVPASDTTRPAFCSPLDLKLEWGTEKEMDSLLADWSNGNNILNLSCDPGEMVRSFARLQGVPGLYFGKDITSGWSEPFIPRFPTVGIFMKIDGQWAVALWHYRYEMVGCGCI